MRMECYRGDAAPAEVMLDSGSTAKRRTRRERDATSGECVEERVEVGGAHGYR